MGLCSAEPMGVNSLVAGRWACVTAFRFLGGNRQRFQQSSLYFEEHNQTRFTNDAI